MKLLCTRHEHFWLGPSPQVLAWPATQRLDNKIQTRKKYYQPELGPVYLIGLILQ